MTGHEGRTCITCGATFTPSHPYRGEYCPDHRYTSDDLE